MGTETKVTYVCDTCKTRSDSNDFRTSSTSGSSCISISGNEGGLCYGGDWGGTNHNIQMTVCFTCSRKIRDFISAITGDKG